MKTRTEEITPELAARVARMMGLISNSDRKYLEAALDDIATGSDIDCVIFDVCCQRERDRDELGGFL